MEWKTYMKSLSDDNPSFGDVTVNLTKISVSSKNAKSYAEEMYNYVTQEMVFISERSRLLLRAKRRLYKNQSLMKKTSVSTSNTVKMVFMSLAKQIEQMLKFCMMVYSKLCEAFETTLKVAKEFQICDSSQEWFFQFQLGYHRKQMELQMLSFVAEWLVLTQHYTDALNDSAKTLYDIMESSHKAAQKV